MYDSDSYFSNNCCNSQFFLPTSSKEHERRLIERAAKTAKPAQALQRKGKPEITWTNTAMHKGALPFSSSCSTHTHTHRSLTRKWEMTKRRHDKHSNTKFTNGVTSSQRPLHANFTDALNPSKNMPFVLLDRNSLKHTHVAGFKECVWSKGSQDPQ